jgi:hypothetical protein
MRGGGAARGGPGRRARGRPRPGGAARRARGTLARVLTPLAVLVLALALTGCETNEERHAALVREDKLARRAPAAQGLLVTRRSPYVKVLATTVLHDENGTAAVVTLRNDSPLALREVPVSIALHEAHGGTLYSNDQPGLSPPLTHAPLLLPGQSFRWIDDQIPGDGAPGALTVRVGEAPTAPGSPPRIAVSAMHIIEDPANGVGAEGTVINHSTVTQQELVVFAVALRGGRVVAAGRAVLPDAPAGASTPFQVFFIGNPQGAVLQASAPPSTF